ncbi:hypothetical protein M405DRAFT_821393 [Rhizopogon salebrosus TDB-379]|nr:hypothetical protein M405DRAFT_821393 [Rhizopogon salebrosus TDB-379]
MSCLYLIVRYFGLFLALVCGCFGGLVFIPEAVSASMSRRSKLMRVSALLCSCCFG